MKRLLLAVLLLLLLVPTFVWMANSGKPRCATGIVWAGADPEPAPPPVDCGTQYTRCRNCWFELWGWCLVWEPWSCCENPIG